MTVLATLVILERASSFTRERAVALKDLRLAKNIGAWIDSMNNMTPIITMGRLEANSARQAFSDLMRILVLIWHKNLRNREHLRCRALDLFKAKRVLFHLRNPRHPLSLLL